MTSRTFLRRRTRLIALIGVSLAAATAAAVLLCPETTKPRPPAVVANDVSGRATACLATDTNTATASDTVTRIWSAMQAAGTKSTTNVQQMITPAQGAEQAQPHLAGLLSQRCDLIITVGPSFGQAIPSVAKADPKVRFTAVDSSLTAPPPGIVLLSATSAPDSVTQQISALARAVPDHAVAGHDG